MEKQFKIVLFFSILFFSIDIIAQGELDQNHIDSLYSKALQNRIDWILSSGYKYVDLENQSCAPQKVLKSPIKILSQSEIIKISRKENKEFKVYTMSYRIISDDTVDVNFGEYQLKGLKKKGKNSPLATISECKCGVLIYEPDFRFVLIKNRWKIIKSKFLMSK